MVHGPAHRLFLQVMLHRRCLDETEAVDMMKSCCDEFKERVQPLDAFVQELNNELEEMELALRTTMEERKDSDYPCLVLVNLMAGQATRMLSTFSQNELAFIRLLVGEIIASDDGELTLTDAINLGLGLRNKLKASVCEKLVERLSDEKWLLLNDYSRRETCVSLSGLIIAEINTYLEETHSEEILKCFFCTKLTFKGYQCGQCGIAVHRDCGKKYWDTSKKRNTCPGERCEAFLGPTSDIESKRRRNLTNDEVENEEEEEEDDDAYEVMKEEIVTPQKGRVTLQRGRGVRRKRGEE